MKIKVLGIGSPFGDDQAGWKVVENLQNQKNISPGVKIEQHDRPGLRLLELMHDADIVYLIDAVKSGKKIGTLYRLEESEINENIDLLSTHGMGISQALELGRALNILPKTIILYGIEIDKAIIQKTISTQVMQAIQSLSIKLELEIQNLFLP